MAETVVSLVGCQLNSFITEEVRLLKGVVSEVRSIQYELDLIRAFLKDADAKAERDEEVKVWVKQVRQLAFCIEDVLDKFRFRLAPHRHNRGISVRKASGWVSQWKARHDIGKEIRKIKASLAERYEQSGRYRLSRSPEQAASSSESTGVDSRHYIPLYTEESELVGIDTHKNKLIEWLVQGEERRKVFAVVGTGGVGKTTVVRKAYECDASSNHFECHAWIVVSQSFKLEHLLRKLISQLYESRKEPVPHQIGAMETTRLIDNLRDYLQNKRYVVILDDVWTTQLWDQLQPALRDNHSGSRIMITTRTNDVACSFVESQNHIYNLSPLSLEDALLLFNKKAFGPQFNGQCPADLEETSKQIVKKSGRLPLAIVVMGGLLRTKEKTVLEWNKFHHRLALKLRDDPNLQSVMKIISLSYHDLPCYLKPCFLYFAMFPEDFNATLDRLTMLWISEGFVKQEKEATFKEVAENYIDELVSRSLIQKEIRVVDDLIDTYCMVHDLMHEFTLLRSSDESYCQVVDNASTTVSNENVRRLSIHNGFHAENLMKISNSSFVRSLFVFQLGRLPRSLTNTFLSSFVLLKVLELMDAPLENFPNEITNMWNLRHLYLSGTMVKFIPNTLGKLQHLEFFYIKSTYVVELPSAILKLQKLRHLYSRRKDFNPFNAGVEVPKGIGCLTSLQSLVAAVEVNQCNIITNLGKLTQLRKLEVTNLRREDGKEFCTSIAKMNHLEFLSVASRGEDEVIDLQFLSSSPTYLGELYLHGNLEKLPDWIASLSNLVIIGLNFSRLKVDPMKAFGSLPNLTNIYLSNAYDGEELEFQAQGFQKLKTLRLSCFYNLHSVMIEKGALPVLKELDFYNCKLLEVVPAGITHLTDLKSLVFKLMSKDLKRRVSPDGGEDYWKVKHIPKVQCTAE